MAAKAKQVFEADRLQAEFDLYDKHVDVVSAFEWLFTQTRELPVDVVHFERYPAIDDHGITRTPDFTVLFEDGSAIIAEVANLAVHENSIEKACRQIGAYAPLRTVPGPEGSIEEATGVDVVLFVPMEAGPRAVNEIISARLHDDDHPYKPDRPPCIVQFTRDESKYMFQRVLDPANGHIAPGERNPHVEQFLDSGLHIPPRHFQTVKSERRFINDPIPALYLATHLWMFTWPTRCDVQGRWSTW